MGGHSVVRDKKGIGKLSYFMLSWENFSIIICSDVDSGTFRTCFRAQIFHYKSQLVILMHF